MPCAAVEAARLTSDLIQRSQQNAEKGVAVTVEVAEAIHGIGESARRVEAVVADIKAGAGEQSRGVDQVNSAAALLSQTTQSAAATAEESASATEDLSSQGKAFMALFRDLSDLVDGARDQESE